MTTLFIASDRGHTEIVKILLAYGANINDKDNVSNKYNDMTCCVYDYHYCYYLIRMGGRYYMLLLLMVILK